MDLTVLAFGFSVSDSLGWEGLWSLRYLIYPGLAFPLFCAWVSTGAFMPWVAYVFVFCFEMCTGGDLCVTWGLQSFGKTLPGLHEEEPGTSSHRLLQSLGSGGPLSLVGRWRALPHRVSLLGAWPLGLQ